MTVGPRTDRAPARNRWSLTPEFRAEQGGPAVAVCDAGVDRDYRLSVGRSADQLIAGRHCHAAEGRGSDGPYRPRQAGRPAMP